MCLMGNTELLCRQCRRIGPLFMARGKSHGFSRVAAGIGELAQLTAGMAIQNSCLFSDIRTPF